MKEFTPIRCPEDRTHGHYEMCGKLIGAIKDGVIYLYCSECKTFYKIDILDNDVIEMTPLPKNERLNFGLSLRYIGCNE